MSFESEGTPEIEYGPPVVVAPAEAALVGIAAVRAVEAEAEAEAEAGQVAEN